MNPPFSVKPVLFSVFMDAVSLSIHGGSVPPCPTVLVWRVTRCLGSQPTKVNPILLRPGATLTLEADTLKLPMTQKTIPGWWLGHPSEKYESQLG